MRLPPKILQGYTISALVGIRCRVQGLVEIPNEVNDIANGVGALCAARAFILQDRDLFRKRADNTALFAAEALNRTPRRPAWNVDVVPGSILSFRSNIVGPGGNVAHGIADGGTAIAFHLGINGIRA